MLAEVGHFLSCGQAVNFRGHRLFPLAAGGDGVERFCSSRCLHGRESPGRRDGRSWHPLWPQGNRTRRSGRRQADLGTALDMRGLCHGGSAEPPLCGQGAPWRLRDVAARLPGITPRKNPS